MFFLSFVFVSSESLEIRSIGQVGFIGTSNVSTALTQVILDLDYNSSATVCSCNNYNGSVQNNTWNKYFWSKWDNCSSVKFWTIDLEMSIDENSSQKYVRCLINHTNGNVSFVSDDILYEPIGLGLDNTQPDEFEILIDEDYVSYYSNSKIFFNWTRSYDFESEYLKIPLIYYFRISQNSLNITDWILLGNQNYVDIDIYDYVDESQIFLQDDEILYEVKVVNSADLYYIAQKNLTIDNSLPEIESVDSPFINSDDWYSYNSQIFDIDELYFNWTGTDFYSGIYCYSFILTDNLSLDPDNICDGPIGSFNLKTNHMYNNLKRNLKEGINYFKIKAIDNAGNIGPTYNFEIKIDSKAPNTPLVYDQGLVLNNTFENNRKKGIIFNWTNNDYGCGVTNHFVQVSSDINFNTLEFNDYTNSSLNFFNFSSFKDGIYFIKVQAIDCMGHRSSFSDVTKTTKQADPLIIYDYLPKGNVIGKNPDLYVETSKDATCYFLQNGNYSVFDFTQGYFHTHPLRLDYSFYSFEILCNDSISNEVNFNLDFTTKNEFFISSVILQSENSAYQGSIFEIDLRVSPFVSQLRKNDLYFYLNNKLSDNFIIREINGNYKLFFEVPYFDADENIEIYVELLDQKSNILEVNTLKPRLVVSLENPLLRTNIKQTSEYENIIYFNSEEFSFGISSLGKNLVDLNKFEVVSNVDSEYYFFLTQNNFEPFRKEDSLFFETFNKLTKPSFGFSSEVTDYIYELILAREDSDFHSDYQISSGKQSIILQNQGKTQNGKRKIYISANKVQNLTKGDFVAN